MLYKISNDYYSFLCKDSEFIRDSFRVYFIVFAARYRNKRVQIGVPLRANINKNFQQDTHSYIQTPSTNHTKDVAGWHITKLIPVSKEVLISVPMSDDKLLSEQIARKHLQKIKYGVQRILSELEKGNNIYGVINFDRALDKLSVLSHHISLPTISQEQLDVAKKHGFSAEAAAAVVKTQRENLANGGTNSAASKQITLPDKLSKSDKSK